MIVNLWRMSLSSKAVCREKVRSVTPLHRIGARDHSHLKNGMQDRLKRARLIGPGPKTEGQAQFIRAELFLASKIPRHEGKSVNGHRIVTYL